MSREEGGEVGLGKGVNFGRAEIFEGGDGLRGIVREACRSGDDGKETNKRE